MRLILANHILASEGDYRMFVRMAGTDVTVADFYKDGFLSQESAIVIQKYGSPNHDSGEVSSFFPPTIVGLRAAKVAWQSIASRV